eukprot:SAG31_NODE_3980_length_3700_cov_1.781727_3_plen_135_part_00
MASLTLAYGVGLVCRRRTEPKSASKFTDEIVRGFEMSAGEFVVHRDGQSWTARAIGARPYRPSAIRSLQRSENADCNDVCCRGVSVIHNAKRQMHRSTTHLGLNSRPVRRVSFGPVDAKAAVLHHERVEIRPRV